MIKRAWLPDEIDAAIETLRHSTKAAAPTHALRTRYAAFYLWLFCLGCWVALGLYELNILGIQSTNFWRSALTVLSVLTGFMITTMLFTGKAEAAKSLTLEQLDQFCSKSNHLLVSQFCTLISHICGLMVIGVATALESSSSSWINCLVPLVGGFLVTSFFRCLLVPIQIIELHRFVHAALLNEKRAEIKNNLGGL